MKTVYRIEREPIEIKTTKTTYQPNIGEYWANKTDFSPETVAEYETSTEARAEFNKIEAGTLRFCPYHKIWQGEAYLLTEIILDDDGKTEYDWSFYDIIFPQYPEED